MCHSSHKRFSELTDSELCALVCGGDELAFEEITRRYKGLILTISKEYSYPGFDSADFMQLGLMGLYSASKTYKSDEGISFKNFAAVCIRRRYISLVRSLSSRKAVPKEAVVSVEEAELVSRASDPATLIADKENDESFYSLLKSKLSYMELCALKGYVNGMSYKEIAKATGLSTKAVDNALQRARKKLLK